MLHAAAAELLPVLKPANLKLARVSLHCTAITSVTAVLLSQAAINIFDITDTHPFIPNPSSSSPPPPKCESEPNFEFISSYLTGSVSHFLASL